ncbi:MAG: hypothetical protein DRP71_14175 [Verrucomicrobia bacterium]|nr:MAG: hypothetical protein DRP71_14175 [Verrucomicrobiota bacterium]
MPGKSTLKESDLYPPLRDFLVTLGYRVRSEVAGCDVTAVLNDQLVVIEIKRALTLDLLTQGIRRQRTADSVYLAVPAPTTEVLRKRHRAVYPVVKRLELGLILVDPNSVVPVKVAFHPIPYKPRRDKQARRALVREQANRSTDGNRGGSQGLPILTAYRENALVIALLLRRTGPSRPRDIRDAGGGGRTLTILSNNVYGWFERIDRGVYALSAQGETGLETYNSILPLLEQKLDGKGPGSVNKS